MRQPRLTLRLLNAGDRAEFIRIHHDSHEFFRPWLPTPAVKQSLEDLFEQQLDRATRGWVSGKELRMVSQLDDGRIAGLFNLNEIVYGSFWSAYAGWRIAREVAHQGYGTESLAGLLDVAFAKPPAGIGLHRVQANVIPTNVASLRLAEKCGFRREGLAVKYLQIEGRWQDHIMLAKLTDEHTPVYLRPEDYQTK